MSLDKSYQKQSIANQVLILNAFDRIERMKEESKEVLDAIYFDVNNKISTIQARILGELKTQTKLLRNINSTLVKEKQHQKQNVEKSVVSSQPTKSWDNVGSALLGVAVGALAIGGAIQLLSSGGGVDIRTAMAVSISIGVLVPSIAFSMEQLGKFKISEIDNLMFSLSSIAMGVVVVGAALSITPPVDPRDLITATTIALAFPVLAYTMGEIHHVVRPTIFGWLTSTATKRVANMMQAFVLMTAAIPIVAGLVSITPKISLEHAASVVLISAAFVPLSMTMPFMRTAFFLMKDVSYAGMFKAAVGLGMVAALLPVIADSAKAIPTGGISQGTIDAITSLSWVMVPLAVITASIAWLINSSADRKLTREMNGIGLGGGGKGKKKPLTVKQVAVYVLSTVLAIGAVAAIGYALTMIPDDFAKTVDKIPLIALGKMGLIIGIFGLISVAMINFLRGSATKSKSGIFGFGGSFEENTGDIKPQDVLAAAALLPLIAYGIVGTAYAFMALPERERMYRTPPTGWVLRAGLTLTMFAIPFAILLHAFGSSGGGQKAMMRTAIVMGGISVGISAIALAFSILPTTWNAPDLWWSIQAGFALTVFAGVFWLVGKYNKGGKRSPMHKGAQALKEVIPLMVLTIMGIATGMYIWSKADVEIADVLLLGATIIGLGGTMAAIGAIPGADKFIKKGAIAMLFASVPLILISAGMVVWATAMSKLRKPWQAVAVLGATIGALGLAMALAGIGPMPLFIALGAGAMLIAAGALYVIASAIAKFGSQWDNIKQLADSHKTQKRLIGGGKATNFEALMTAIAYGFTINPVSLALMGMAIPVLLGASVALIGIGKGLSMFTKLDIDLDELAVNIPSVLTIVSESFAIVGAKYGSTLFTTSPVAKGIRAVRGVGEVLFNIAKGVQEFANLSYVNEDGKRVTIPKEWLEPGTGKIPLAIKSVLGVVGDAFAELGRANGETNWFRKGFIEKGVKAIQGAGVELSGIASTIKDIATLKFRNDKGQLVMLTEKELGPDGTIIRRIKTMISSIGLAFQEIGEMNGTTNWFKSGKIEKGVKAVKGAGAQVSELAKAVVNIANLKFEDPEKPGTFIDVAAEWLMGGSGRNDVSKGLVYLNIVGAITAITAGLAIAAKNEDAIEDGIDALEDIDQLGSLFKVIKDFAKLKDIDKTAIIIDKALRTVPNSIITAYKILKSDGIEGATDFFEVMPDKLGDLVNTLYDYADPLDRIAHSFEKMAGAMGKFKKHINALDKLKLESLGSFFKNTKDIIYQPNGEMVDDEFFDKMAMAVELGVKAGNPDNANSNVTINTNTENSKRYSKAEQNADTKMYEMMADKLDNLSQAILRLESRFNGEIDVHVTNNNSLVQ